MVIAARRTTVTTMRSHSGIPAILASNSAGNCSVSWRIENPGCAGAVVTGFGSFVIGGTDSATGGVTSVGGAASAIAVSVGVGAVPSAGVDGAGGASLGVV